METKDYLTNYYERYDEGGRLISKHGMVEYITTMKYIEKYLKPNMHFRRGYGNKIKRFIAQKES